MENEYFSAHLSTNDKKSLLTNIEFLVERLHVMNTVNYKWEEGEVQTFINLQIFRYGGIVSEQKKCVLVLQRIFVDCNDVYTLEKRNWQTF